jgi:transmembrane sensor
MKSNRFRDEWDAISDKGFLPTEVQLRMWKNIQNNTINQYKNYYKWAVAACVVFVLTIAGYQIYTPIVSPVVSIASIRTFDKDVRVVCLPDGTRVWLNHNTEIKYPVKFSDHERTITLKGEAFFEVKRDTLRPFIISSGPIKTTVLGTSFNVMAYYGQRPEVKVRNGKVKVQSRENTVFLERGDKAVYGSAASIVSKQKTNILEPEWKKVLIYVDGLTLSEVISILQKEHDFSVNYLDDDLKNLKIQGTLNTRQGLDEMLQTIAFAMEIKISPTGNNTYLIGR